MTDTIFWNVDTQYDFMRDDESFKGKLAVPGARSIEQNLERITRYAREHGIKVVSTRDWHTPESKEFSDAPNFIATFPPHCLQQTRGAEYVPATQPINAYEIDWRDQTFDEREVHSRRNIVINKDAFDAFDPQGGNPHTAAVLKMLKPGRAVVYGVATNYCVDAEVQGLLERGVEVYVVEDAIKAIVAPDGGIPTPCHGMYPTIDAFFADRWLSRGVKLTTTDSIDSIVGR